MNTLRAECKNRRPGPRLLTAPLSMALLAAAACSGPASAPSPASPWIGLRSVVYHVADLPVARDWYRQALGRDPSFDEAFYVGFDLGGSELGLDPDISSIPPGAAGGIAYWKVTDIEDMVFRLIELGATARDPITDVGGGLLVATVTDPFDNVLGLLQEPPADAR